MSDKTYTKNEVLEIIENVYEVYHIESSNIYKEGFERYLNGMGLNGNNGAGEAYDEEYHIKSIEYFLQD